MPKSVPKMSSEDVSYAVKELNAWRDHQRGRKLSWSLLEKSVGFSRQALCTKPDIAAAFDEAKKALSIGARPRPAKSDDFLTDRIKRLEAELDRYRGLEADWLERWVRITYHARGKGLSMLDLDKPLPPASRK